jgi:phage gpG-like protein
MADAAEFTFESEQWQRIIKRLQKKWDSIASGNDQIRREFSGIVAAVVYGDIVDHFKQEKGPDGAWVEWSKSYQEHLNKIGRGSNNKLVFDAKLINRITPEQSKEAIHRNTNQGILFYNNAKTKSGYPYAAGHDQGGSVKGRPPQRKFMWLSDKGMNRIVNNVSRWLAEK